LDQGKLIAEVLRLTQVRVGPKDPVFAAVEMNRLALEESVGVLLRQAAKLANSITAAGTEMTEHLEHVATQRIQGNLESARQVLESDAKVIRRHIASDANEARHAAAMAIQEVANFHRQGDIVSTAYLTISVALALTLLAFMAGTRFAPALANVPVCQQVRAQR